MDNLINALFNTMRNDLGVMAEYGDNEDALLEELRTATPDILDCYADTFL